MQFLPVRPSPNSMEHDLLDRGFYQRGASTLRVDRPGTKFAILFGFPPMDVDAARAFVSKMLRGSRQGLQINIPTLVKQGIPGSPVVDGNVTGAATSIAVRGLTPSYVAKEQFWMTIVRSDGTAYLHSVFETVVANGSGEATIEIEPPLRAPFVDGDTIHLGKPFMQGFIEGGFKWKVDGEQFVELSALVEEYR